MVIPETKAMTQADKIEYLIREVGKEVEDLIFDHSTGLRYFRIIKCKDGSRFDINKLLSK